MRTFQVADGGGHLPVDLVVFDTATEFTVRPWVVESLDRPFSSGDVIVGGRRPEQVGERFSLQGVELVVHGRLCLTGVGPFERSLFIARDTADRLATARVIDAAGMALPRAPLAAPSGLLLRLTAGRGPDDLRFAAAWLADVTVVTGNGSQIDVRQAVATLGHSSLALLVCLLTPAVLVGVACTGMLTERWRELGLLHSIGLRRLDVVLIVAVEAIVAALAGGLAGVLLAAAVLAVFVRTVGFLFARREIPFVVPEPLECLWMGLGSLPTGASPAAFSRLALGTDGRLALPMNELTADGVIAIAGRR